MMNSLKPTTFVTLALMSVTGFAGDCRNGNCGLSDGGSYGNLKSYDTEFLHASYRPDSDSVTRTAGYGYRPGYNSHNVYPSQSYYRTGYGSRNTGYGGYSHYGTRYAPSSCSAHGYGYGYGYRNTNGIQRSLRGGFPGIFSGYGNYGYGHQGTYGRVWPNRGYSNYPGYYGR